MARTVRDAKLETRAARDRLTPGPMPHWKTLVPGKVHLGYRRKKKDQPGSWLVRIYVGEGHYKKIPLGKADDFEDATAANDYLSFADAQRMAHDSRVERRSGKAKTVADAVALYVARLRGEGRDATAADAEKAAVRNVLPRLGRIRLADLTTRMLTDWRDALAREPSRLRTRAGQAQQFKPRPVTKDAGRARRASVNRIMAVLMAALNRAFRDGLIDNDVAWRRVEAFDRVDAARPNFLTVAECQRLVNAADRDSGFRDLVQAALQTGCRYGELAALEVRDLHRGKVHVRDSKTGKPRDVVLSDEGIAFFEHLTAGRSGNAPMLGRQWSKSEQFRPMRQACLAANIAPPITFHGLRHTWASLAVMNGMPLLVVARNLGHADGRMVERVYGHLTQTYIDDEVRKAAPTFGFKTDGKVVSVSSPKGNEKERKKEKL